MKVLPHRTADQCPRQVAATRRATGRRIPILRNSGVRFLTRSRGTQRDMASCRGQRFAFVPQASRRHASTNSGLVT